MKVTKILVVLIVSMTMVSCGNQRQSVTKLESEIDTVSYAVGLNMGAQIKKNFNDINKEAYVQGILDALDSVDLLVTSEDSQSTVQAYFSKKQQEAQMKQFGPNKKAGEDFLADNKSKDGVITTASGLQYKVITEGKGAKPKATNKVRLHYHGTTIDGKVFDSSVERKTPYELGVNQFVTGFSEGLQLMNVGSKYMFYIPQELAYGPANKGPMIPPYSALVFEVELLDILDK